MLIWVNFGVSSVYFGLLFLTAFLGCRRSFLVLLYLFFNVLTEKEEHKVEKTNVSTNSLNKG